MEQLTPQEKRKLRIEQRNKAIKEDYEKLSEERYKGVRVYTEELKVTKLAEKYFLSEKWIEDIVYNRIK